MTLHRIAIACAAAFALIGSAHAAPQDEVMAAFQKSMEKGAYTAVIEGDGMRTELAVQFPDRFHMKNPQAETIILPEGSWIKAGGQWMKAPMDMSQVVQGFNQKAIKQGLDGLQDVRVIGEEEIGGCASTVYGYRVTDTSAGGASVAAEVAICGDSGLPVRVVSKAGKGPATTITYDYDAPVQITAPL